MKKQTWILAFFVALGADVAGIQTGNETLQLISKPLILPLLAVYFLTGTGAVSSPLKKWILAALFFSWGGDVLLMFQDKNDLYFLLGLSSFLLAHIFYILFFHRVRISENIKSNPWYLLLVVLYYLALISWLSPYLGEMKLPVRIYGVVISTMFMMALHMPGLRKKSAGVWMLAGACFFVLSDSLLAVNKFYRSFEAAGIGVMLTYGLAQLFIVKGAIEYLRGQQHSSL
ncbi:MAG: lysoplasmalogenase [Sphingobacteriales bacterium]|nr:lysoplasmalogenase [Sphingobacteriales bacterium]